MIEANVNDEKRRVRASGLSTMSCERVGRRETEGSRESRSLPSRCQREGREGSRDPRVFIVVAEAVGFGMVEGALFV